jgi:hypothetical protein
VSAPSLPHSRRAAAFVVFAFAALELGYAIWVAFVAHGPVGPRVGYGPDSAVYIAAARAPVWSRHFLAGPGAFGFLLLAKVCARNLRAIVIVQSLLAVAAWTLLATTAVGVVRSNLARWVALVGILGLGLAPGVVQWNAFITTESLSLSLLCVVVALGLRVARRGDRRELVAFVVAIAAFAYTRDTNSLVVGVLAVVALVLATRRSWRVRGVVIGVAGLLFAFSAATLANAAEPPRWYWPLAETTSIRLLADPGATRYLVDHGFPLDARTRALPGKYIFIVSQVTESPAYRPFRRWVRVDGRRVYVDFLVTHPGWALRKPFDDRKALFDLGVIEGYGDSYVNHPGGPFAVIGAIAAPRSSPFAELWTVAGAIAVAGLFWRRASGRALLGAVAITGSLAIVAYYSAWHGDALEVYRHALSATVELRLALWLVTVLAVDACMMRARDGSAIGVPGEADLDGEQERRAPDDEERRHRDPTATGGG